MQSTITNMNIQQIIQIIAIFLWIAVFGFIIIQLYIESKRPVQVRLYVMAIQKPFRATNNTPLMVAIKEKDVDGVKDLLLNTTFNDINYVNSNSSNALIFAINTKMDELIRLVLNHPLLQSLEKYEDNTKELLLNTVIINDQFELLKELLTVFDYNISDNNNVLFLAMRKRDFRQYVDLLFNFGANPNLINDDGITLMTFVIDNPTTTKFGMSDRIATLMEYGVNPNMIDENDQTPLMKVYNAFRIEQTSLFYDILSSDLHFGEHEQNEPIAKVIKVIIPLAYVVHSKMLNRIVAHYILWYIGTIHSIPSEIIYKLLDAYLFIGKRKLRLT
jgi:hypothetical protein